MPPTGEPDTACKSLPSRSKNAPRFIACSAATRAGFFMERDNFNQQTEADRMADSLLLRAGRQFDREKRLYDDTTTTLAEALEGFMRTPFEYRFDGRELYGRDDGPLGPVLVNALID